MNMLNSQDKKTLDNFKDMSVGQIFTKARTSQRLEIEQIASYLNIGTAHLEAIEADDKNKLPPQVYAVGFVRAYADALGLDSEKMAYLFKIQSYGVKKTEEQKALNSVRQGETVSIKTALRNKINYVSLNFLPLIIMALVGLAIALILWLLIWLIWPNNDVSRESRIPDVNEMIAPVANEAANEGFVETPQTGINPTEPMDVIIKPADGQTSYGANMLESNLVLKATEESWIEIRDVKSGDILLSNTLNKGDVFYTPKGTDILLTSGNAGGVEVYLDGSSLGLLGKKREIVRLRPLSVNALRLQNAE